MKIMVFDVPAEFGGALTILKQYYERACEDKENEWVFIVSKPDLKETENIKILKFPEVKKSWLNRLFFDNFTAKKLVKKYNPDKIISLQNTLVNAKGYFQELYVHQPLPFSEKRFSLKENKKFWVYQNIISKMIISSVKKADSVIVQTNWMRDAVTEKSKIDINKIKIQAPVIKIDETVKYEKTEEINFFYPASSVVYKNHKTIYKAVDILKEKGYTNFNIYLTLDKPEGEFPQNIKFMGYMAKDRLNCHYKKSCLLFASYIETFGLPLLEARTYSCPVIASDTSFSREILSGYDKAMFFNPFSAEDLAEKMIEYINRY